MPLERCEDVFCYNCNVQAFKRLTDFGVVLECPHCSYALDKNGMPTRFLKQKDKKKKVSKEVDEEEDKYTFWQKD